MCFFGSKWKKMGPDIVKKRLSIFPSPAGMSLPNSPWPGIIKLFPAREGLVSDIPAGDLFYSVLFIKTQQEEILKCVSWLLWFLLLLPKPAFAFPIGRWSFHAPAENPWCFYFYINLIRNDSISHVWAAFYLQISFRLLDELPWICFYAKAQW